MVKCTGRARQSGVVQLAVKSEALLVDGLLALVAALTGSAAIAEHASVLATTNLLHDSLWMRCSTRGTPRTRQQILVAAHVTNHARREAFAVGLASIPVRNFSHRNLLTGNRPICHEHSPLSPCSLVLKRECGGARRRLQAAPLSSQPSSISDNRFPAECRNTVPLACRCRRWFSQSRVTSRVRRAMRDTRDTHTCGFSRGLFLVHVLEYCEAELLQRPGSRVVPSASRNARALSILVCRRVS